MDKLNSALIGVEDNLERIKRLERELAELKSKKTVTVKSGKVLGTATNFGACNGGLAIVTFAGSSAVLRHGTQILAEGESPIIAELGESGLLLLMSAKQNAKAYVIR